jgi:hypothetical protein
MQSTISSDSGTNEINVVAYDAPVISTVGIPSASSYDQQIPQLELTDTNLVRLLQFDGLYPDSPYKPQMSEPLTTHAPSPAPNEDRHPQADVSVTQCNCALDTYPNRCTTSLHPLTASRRPHICTLTSQLPYQLTIKQLLPLVFRNQVFSDVCL